MSAHDHREAWRAWGEVLRGLRPGTGGLAGALGRLMLRIAGQAV